MPNEGLSVVEKKVLGALLILADSNMVTEASSTEIAHTMGYQKQGGIITYALKVLEMKNYVAKLAPRTYKVLI